MLVALLRFEWRYYASRMASALVVAVMAFFSWALVATTFGDDSVPVNSPYNVTQAFGLLSLWLLFSQTLFCASGVLRDEEHGMHELVQSRPIGDLHFVLSRFGGLCLAGLATMAIAAMVLMVLPPFVVANPAQVGPIQLRAYLWPFVTLVVPNLLLISALLLAAALFTRRTVPTYVAGVVIFAVYMLTAFATGSPMLAGSAPQTPEGLARAAWLDPFGLSAFAEQTRYWTPAERTQQLVSLSGRYLANRVIVVALSVVTVWITWHAAPWRGAPRARRRGAILEAPEHTNRPPQAAAPVVPVAVKGVRASLRALASLSRFELRRVFGSWAVLGVLAGWFVIAAIEARSGLVEGEYGTSLIATSGMLVTELRQIVSLVSLLAISYLGADVPWASRIHRIAGITDATPVSSPFLYLPKLVALIAVPLAITTVGMLAALTAQLTTPHLAVAPTVYLASLWFIAYPLCLFAVGVLAIQVLSSNRWIGLVLSLAFTVVTYAAQIPALEHPMTRFGAAPLVNWSDLDGFGPNRNSFALFMVWWTAVAAVLAVLSAAAWRRGADSGLMRRLRHGLDGASSAVRTTLVGSAAAVLALAGFIVWRTDVIRGWEGSSANVMWRHDYERTWRRLESRPQPVVSTVDLDLAFAPASRSAHVQGMAFARNAGDRPIDSIWVVLRRDVRIDSVVVAGGGLVTLDPRFRVYTFALDRPLLPGDSVSVHYGFRIDRNTLHADEGRADVAANGSYLTITHLLPTFGYRAGYELSDSLERTRLGLGHSSATSRASVNVDSAIAAVRQHGQTPDWINWRATVSTSLDQTVAGPAVLRRTWTDGDRRVFEYASESLATPVLAFTSGRYAVRKRAHGAVSLEVWHHPSHGVNADAMLDAAGRTLDLLGPSLGAYPWPALRIVEVPAGWPFGAFALPGMIALTEDRGMLTRPDTRNVDLVMRRVAHEVAHQWWGHRVSPPNLPGASVIVETLAKHAERKVVAAMRGDSAVPNMLAFDHDRYLSGRAEMGTGEPALIAADGESHLYYGKGAMAMHALSNALGQARVDSVLASLVRTESGPRGSATAPGLHRALRQAAPDEAGRTLVDEWFTDRVIYHMSVDSAEAVARENTTQLRASFAMDRVTMTASGETVTPARHVTAEVAIEGPDGAVLWGGVVLFVDGRAQLTLALDRVPTSVTIDPRLLRIDRDRSNNRRTVRQSTSRS